MKESKNRRIRQSKTSAFTLVEVMLAATISVIAIASIAATFIVFASGSKSVGAYVEMSQDSRKALELFGRDLRVAKDVLDANESLIVIELPDDSFHNGETIQYDYDASGEIFSRIERDKDGDLVSNEILLKNLDEFEFQFYDPLGDSLDASSSSLLLSIKSVRVDAEMIRFISQTQASDYIISARFMMRNRPVTL
ncbi:MAG: PilW family protein [Opitutales bacterium]